MPRPKDAVRGNRRILPADSVSEECLCSECQDGHICRVTCPRCPAPDHRLWLVWSLFPSVYANTLPLPFSRPVIIARRGTWHERPDYRAHEFVHLEQIEDMGGWRYLATHAWARFHGAGKYIGYVLKRRVPLRSLWRWAMAVVFLAQEHPIEEAAYDAQRIAAVRMKEGLPQ